ncbi:hypothetical protein C5167_030911 [Papaver somniferum]|nr:hypothetical protein C5167_030911 [Papaver somniferum]
MAISPVYPHHHHISLVITNREPPSAQFLRKKLSHTSRFQSSSRGLSSPSLKPLVLNCSFQKNSTADSERLFSNLNQVTLKREPGSLISAILLVAGTTVGAGILAIPAVTQEAGFLASAITCIFCWLYMVVSGLLLAEVNINTMCELGSGGVSLVSMAKRTLGSVGVQVACQRFIGAVNGVLVGSIVVSFAALVGVASGDLHWEALLRANFEAVPLSIPIIALSFVYQNVVPVLCTDLEGNLSKVRTAIVLGTAIPLGLFLVWDGVILGTIPSPEVGMDKISDPIQLLRSSNGVVGPIIEVFSFLAIATSYIGFVLGLTDFLSDLLKLPSGQRKPLPYLLTLFPPLVLSLLDPEIFFKALDFAGTYGERQSNSAQAQITPRLVPGGKITLAFMIGGAGYVISSEILENLGFLLHP